MNIIERLTKIQDLLESKYFETNQLVDEIVNTTSSNYTNKCEKYSQIRHTTPSDWDMKLNTDLINFVRQKINNNQLQLNKENKWNLLDIGAGSGRDMLFFNSIDDINPIGIENSDGFLNILNNLIKQGELKENSIFKNDMRDLSNISTGSIHCVRNHATLHHLPLLYNGIGMDEAIFETYRVLKKNGVFYILTKYGNEAKMMDTNEGLGSRFFQFLDEERLSKLVKKYGFKIHACKKISNDKGNKNVVWVHLIAEKL